MHWTGSQEFHEQDTTGGYSPVTHRRSIGEMTHSKFHCILRCEPEQTREQLEEAYRQELQRLAAQDAEIKRNSEEIEWVFHLKIEKLTHIIFSEHYFQNQCQDNP